ncbi:MAG: PhzF family phenazine biosynthesis protein, partial [Burkholderiales bacterium]|nr:PhzF family phenazine biosynthesis protein [Anaerolineae bacterium]
FVVDHVDVWEDAATGSANGGLAGYLARYKYFGSESVEARVEQGYPMRRPSLLLLRSHDHGDVVDVHVGGHVVSIARGELL